MKHAADSVALPITISSSSPKVPRGAFLRVDGEEVGGGRAKRVTGIEEGTCWHEHRVLYVSNESLGFPPEAIIPLYVH